MIDYGRTKEFVFHIEHVDYYPELSGIKISNIPTIVICSIIPLWFQSLPISVLILISLSYFFYVAGRKEDEGNPVTINHKLIKIISYLPRVIRDGAIPSVASIKPFNSHYRR